MEKRTKESVARKIQETKYKPMTKEEQKKCLEGLIDQSIDMIPKYRDMAKARMNRGAYDRAENLLAKAREMEKSVREMQSYLKTL